MILKETSFTKNVTTNGASTPDFTQDIGQNKAYYMDYQGFAEICVAMLYYQVYDYENITAPLGKGGRRQSLDNMDNYNLEIASIFDNVYINGIPLVDESFIMFVIKEEREIHHGRRQLKFSRDARYNDKTINESCIQAISHALGCSENGSWIVTEMNIGREPDSRPRLEFSAIVVDEKKPRDFKSVQERSLFIKSIKPSYYDSVGFDTIKSQDYPLQKIYYGTPGSGKSHKVKEIVEGLYPEEQERDKYVFRTTFHPDSDYASFVGCYKPQMDETGDIKYEFTPQAFTNAYARAWKESEKQVYLVIEEINRGNCAQIFGDLFQLLDRKGGVSEYPINADTDLRQYLEKDDILGKGHEGIANGKLKLPANLNIVATMNTSDQSLFPMDSAFKRRWSWECVPINYDDDKSGAFAITIGNSRYKWLEFLKAVNKKIFKATDSEDKQMGNFFINGDVEKRQFIDKVMFYLWNDICKEEYRTTNNFFRIFVDDKKIETTEFSFNELFGTNAETLLKGFMAFLGVEPIQSEGDASVTETNTD